MVEVFLPKQAKKKRLLLLYLHHAHPRRGIPEEKEGMNERDLSQKTPPRHTSPPRGTPDNTEGVYPADTILQEKTQTCRQAIKMQQQQL
jgi:hypothetical protein